MKRRSIIQAGTLAGLTAGIAWPLAALAQDKPPLRLLVGFPPGASSDTLARTLGERIGPELKQTVVVDNKPGAAGRIAAELLRNSAPDGNTIMLCPIVVTVLAPLVFSKLPYNPTTDFAPIAQLTTIDFGVAVNASHPAKNINELITWMRANPQQGNFGTPGAGSLPHFFGVMLAKAAGVDLVHVPYQGGAQSMTAVLGNQVTCIFDTMTDLIEQHKAGKVRILATASTKRNAIVPEVATFAEQGLRDVQGSSWFGLYTHAKAPEGAIRAINAAVNKALQASDVRERLAKIGMEATGGSPEDLAAYMKRDTDRWGPVVKASGFRAD